MNHTRYNFSYSNQFRTQFYISRGIVQGKKLSFQFTCPLGQVQCVFCLSEPQNYLSKNRQPQQY